MRILLGLALASLLAAGAVSLSDAAYTSPGWQARQGVMPEDVLCRDDLVLVIKYDGSPACVNNDSAFMLLQHGWAERLVGETKPHTDTPKASNDTWIDQDYVDEDVAHSPSGGGGSGGGGASPQVRSSGGASVADGVAAEIGFAVGGAQDINNFRANVENGFLPLHTDMTYEGLFYDYYFDTGAGTECEELFCPSYSVAVSADPFSGDDEYYLSVGLNSGLTEADFERKKLNLVIVLDVSGSMDSQFDSYYYDSAGNHVLREDRTGDDLKTKMQLASESVAGMLDHLNGDDSLGVVLFDDQAHTSKPLESMGSADREKLADNILGIRAGGGTNMEAGMIRGTSLFDGALAADPDEYENRIIFLTDAMPNLGDTSEHGLFGMIEENAGNGIHTTFIGVGVDLNTELVEELTKVRGANYYSIHSAGEFKNRMVDEFEFMVTPLVFNLLLSLDADGYDIREVYGSPESDESTGQIMKVNTLFPSRTSDGQTKGGIVLLKLERTSDDPSLVLRTSYEDRSGTLGGDQVSISLDDTESDHYDNTGIRKGILLSRYAELMKTWVFDERLSQAGDDVPAPAYREDGIYIPDRVGSVHLGQWERQSIQLQVSDRYEKLITEFNEYFNREMDAIGDMTLQQEVDILNKLGNY